MQYLRKGEKIKIAHTPRLLHDLRPCGSMEQTGRQWGGRGVAALWHICNFNCINMQKPQKMHKVLSPPTKKKNETGESERGGKNAANRQQINNLEAGKTSATNSFLKGAIGDENEIIYLIWMRFSNWIECWPRQTGGIEIVFFTAEFNLSCNSKLFEFGVNKMILCF